MNPKVTFCLIVCISFLFVHCEDPIDVTVNDSDPLLVVEGTINWIKETLQTEQEITLSLSSSYFSEQRIPANGATVFVSDSKNVIYQFQEKENSGIYFPIDTLPYRVNEKFTLSIEYKNELYSAEESLQPVVSIDSIRQETIDFFGREALQFEAYSLDPEGEKNYSFFEFTSERLDAPEYNVYRDDFNDGGSYYGFLLDRDFETGDQIRIRQYGLSNIGYNYWYLLILQNTQQGGGGPFQTPPVNLNGNLINQADNQKNPLGYFRVSEVSEVLYTVE
ncbi:MAG: DUF4249 domain-containing protein [Flavobacteriaceae bacterium]